MTRAKLAIRLGLGILCGLALVLVPLVFSTSTPTNALLPRTATTNTTNPYDYVVGHVQSSNFTGGPSAVPISGASLSLVNLSVLMIILFIFVPSVVFSLVIRKWAERRARDYL